MSTESTSARAPAEPLPRGAEGTPLYVHLPFCATKCHYCDFFSVPGEGQDIDGMVAAILEEARHRAPRAPRTVFLGGGTPSLLSAGQLRTLLDGLDEITGWRASAVEVTAECNPESLDEPKAAAFLALGVPRLSIGFQSLDDSTLGLFNRVHTADMSFAAFAAARAAGIEHLNVDLIYAAPGQTAETWERDLARMLDLGPDHLSAYNLTFEEDTRFKRMLERGQLAQTDEEVELAMFETTRRLATAEGLEAYEISNYARGGEACAHNLNYWRNGEYVGLGPGAVSKVGHARAGNPRGIAPYLKGVRAHGYATQWREDPAATARLSETWWLGLRLARGLDPEEARATSGAGEEAAARALELAEELVGHDLLERTTEGRFALTSRGLPLADAVARRFLDGLD